MSMKNEWKISRKTDCKTVWEKKCAKWDRMCKFEKTKKKKK